MVSRAAGRITRDQRLGGTVVYRLEVGAGAHKCVRRGRDLHGARSWKRLGDLKQQDSVVDRTVRTERNVKAAIG